MSSLSLVVNNQSSWEHVGMAEGLAVRGDIFEAFLGGGIRVKSPALVTQ